MPIIQTKKELRPRDKWDFYPTPTGLVRAAITYLDRELPYSRNDKKILDPGSGTGIWGKEAKKVWPHAEIYGCDENFTEAPEEYSFWVNKDFLSDGLPYEENSFDVIVGNPPYRDIERFLEKSWSLLRPRGHMLILSRLALVCGQRRAKNFWPVMKPLQIIPLPMRPSFTGNGKTDATEYMLTLWHKGYTGSTELVFGFEYLRDKDLEDSTELEQIELPPVKDKFNMEKQFQKHLRSPKNRSN